MLNKKRIHEIIFESGTRAGRLFDVWLLITIFLSTLLVMVDSVPSIHAQYARPLLMLEWIITGFFTLEYALRIYSIRRKTAYVFSFFGIVDILSILPTYLSLFLGGAHFLSIIRLLRMVRIFRIFNLRDYVFSGLTIMAALNQSRKKITVFLLFILLMVSVFGGVMYVVESGHPESGFASIPQSIYWAIVTITTVGYGDIAPVTVLGKFLASIVMIMGYAVIAVPTGIVTAEISKQRHMHVDPSQHCGNCGNDDHIDHSNFCCKCGEPLNENGL
jgi:voltage-gated potassium channel